MQWKIFQIQNLQTDLEAKRMYRFSWKKNHFNDILTLNIVNFRDHLLIHNLKYLIQFFDWVIDAINHCNSSFLKTKSMKLTLFTFVSCILFANFCQAFYPVNTVKKSDCLPFTDAKSTQLCFPGHYCEL